MDRQGLRPCVCRVLSTRPIRVAASPDSGKSEIPPLQCPALVHLCSERNRLAVLRKVSPRLPTARVQCLT